MALNNNFPKRLQSFPEHNLLADDAEGSCPLFYTQILSVGGYNTLEGVGDSPLLVAGASIPRKKEI